MSWVGVWLGTMVPTVEVGAPGRRSPSSSRSRSSRTSSCRRETLPGLLRPFAEWNPASALPAATRELWGNPNPVRAGGLPGRAPDPADAHLGGRDRRDLRAAGREEVPLDEPLAGSVSTWTGSDSHPRRPCDVLSRATGGSASPPPRAGPLPGVRRSRRAHSSPSPSSSDAPTRASRSRSCSTRASASSSSCGSRGTSWRPPWSDPSSSPRPSSGRAS